MSHSSPVLLLGATGRTGRYALEELTSRGVNVRAIVRSADKLDAGLRARPELELVEASLLDLSESELQRHVRGCDAVVSCLGHVANLRGVYGAPRDLVTQAVVRVTRAARAVDPEGPRRFVLMSSVSVNQPGRRDARRGAFERGFVAMIRCLLPPARDNQDAADFLIEGVGTEDESLEWVVVRPDSLVEGDESPYEVHDELVDSLFAPGRSTLRNVAHFMSDLVTDDTVWSSWRGKVPVIVDARAANASG